MKGVLYISYDGMLEPLGQSQVLAYQERLAAGVEVHLLSFEKSDDWKNVEERSRLAKRMRDAGIHWHPCRYHKRPSATATTYDILVGIIVGVFLILRHRLRIVHARSYVPSVMALVLKRLTGTKFIFDMRGFWADERVDGGLWSSGGRLYRIAKWFERRFLLNADHVVSLTHAAVAVMKNFDYLQGCAPAFSVIPTCADLDKFSPATEVPKEGFLLGYVGSAGTWYLFDAAVACFIQLLKLRPDARWLIVNRGEHNFIRQRLISGGVPLEVVELRTADHSEVPAQIARMHAGIFFIKPAYSKQASAPTKLAEFLGCGIPCLANSGVGDMADILRGERVGIALPGFSDSAMRNGLEELIALSEDSQTRARCVAAAEKHFSLIKGVSAYREVYDSLLLQDAP